MRTEPQTTFAILSSDELGKILKISSKQVRRLAEMGEIPAIRLGRLWRYRLSDVTEMWDRKMEETKAGSARR